MIHPYIYKSIALSFVSNMRSESKFRAVFIRAPAILSIEDDVKILAEYHLSKEQ